MSAHFVTATWHGPKSESGRTLSQNIAVMLHNNKIKKLDLLNNTHINKPSLLTVLRMCFYGFTNRIITPIGRGLQNNASSMRNYF